MTDSRRGDLVTAGAVLLALSWITLVCWWALHVPECQLAPSDWSDLCSDLGDEAARVIQERDTCDLPAEWRQVCDGGTQ